MLGQDFLKTPESIRVQGHAKTLATFLWSHEKANHT